LNIFFEFEMKSHSYNPVVQEKQIFLPAIT